MLPVLGVAALVLLLAGVFSGPASTGTQPAIAAVIRGVENATALKPGTIVVSKYRVSYRNRVGRPPASRSRPSTRHPSARARRTRSTSTANAASGEPSEQAVSGGDEEVYLSNTNTIYISSIWGPYITKGKRPGTFIYTPSRRRAVTGQRRCRQSR